MFLEDIDLYFTKQKDDWAFIDIYEYPNLAGTEFEVPEIRAQYFYTHNKPKGYKVDFPSPQNFRIYIRVNPCANKRNALCCQNSNESVCEDNTTIISGKDVPIAWFVGGYLVQCEKQFSKQGNCGTYLEIHRPNNPKVEEELQIELNFSNGFNTQYISTKNLCTGRYEFWLVVRTRNGSILQYVKPFFSRYPSCREFMIDEKYQQNYEKNLVYHTAKEERCNPTRNDLPANRPKECNEYWAEIKPR